MSFPERLLASAVAWEQDTLHFHAALFRCFLFHLLDVQLSHRPEWVRAALGQMLANIGLDLDERANDYERQLARCPPQRRYASHATWPVLSFAPMDHTIPIPTSVPPPLHDHIDTNMDNLTHGLGPGFGFGRDELAPTISPGADKDSLVGGVGVASCLLLWVLVLPMVVSLRWSLAETRSDNQAVCRIPGRAVDLTTDVRDRAITGHLHGKSLPASEATRGLAPGGLEQVGHRAYMPGGWFHEQSTFGTCDEPVSNTIPWRHLCSHVQMGFKLWTHFSVLHFIFGISNRGSNDVMAISRNGGLSGSDEFNVGGPTPAQRDGVERFGIAPDDLPSKLGLSESSMAICNGRRLSTVDDVAINHSDPAQTMRLNVVCRDPTRPTFTLVESNHGSHVEDVSSDGESLSIGTRRADERTDTAGERQDGAFSDTGCAPLLRQTRSAGYLWKKRDVDVFHDDDDEGTVDDSYWTEQVNVRLSGERDFPAAPSRYGWSDVHSWPREGREDETDNWRVRSSQVTQDKLRRYSSPPLSANAALSHHATDSATNEDCVRGVYVVPQKRGGRCRSPSPSLRPCDRPSGLGFFPFRKTPVLLTREAWRPGCLYIADPPADEASQAEAWWDRLARGDVGTGTETETRIACEIRSRDVQEGSVSWRDRYENDPASRRIMSSHRRAMTEG